MRRTERGVGFSSIMIYVMWIFHLLVNDANHPPLAAIIIISQSIILSITVSN